MESGRRLLDLSVREPIKCLTLNNIRNLDHED